MNTTPITTPDRDTQTPEDVYQRFLRAQQRMREGHYTVQTHVVSRHKRVLLSQVRRQAVNREVKGRK